MHPPCERWNDLAVASHPAVRFHEISQGEGDASLRGHD